MKGLVEARTPHLSDYRSRLKTHCQGLLGDRIQVEEQRGNRHREESPSKSNGWRPLYINE